MRWNHDCSTRVDYELKPSVALISIFCSRAGLGLASHSKLVHEFRRFRFSRRASACLHGRIESSNCRQMAGVYFGGSLFAKAARLDDRECSQSPCHGALEMLCRAPGCRAAPLPCFRGPRLGQRAVLDCKWPAQIPCFLRLERRQAVALDMGAAMRWAPRPGPAMIVRLL